MVHVQCTHQVDGNQTIPMLRLGLGKGHENIPAGVVDQHSDWAQFLFDRGDGLVNLCSQCDVTGIGVCLAAGLMNGVSGFTSGFQVAIKHRDQRPFVCKSFASRSPDPSATAGDDHNFAIKSLHD